MKRKVTKKQKVTKIFTLVFAIALMVSLFAGCSGNKTAQPDATTASSSTPAATAASSSTPEATPDSTQKIDTTKHVDLIMYLVGEAPKGFDIMNAELNKMLETDINASIKFNFLSWGEYDQKYPLILASGEAFDLIYAANWINFGAQAQKGAFMALDDLLPTYAPELNAQLPRAAVAQSMVNKKLYMIPATAVGDFGGGVMVRGDIMKKYNIPAIKTNEDLEVYLETVKKNVPGLIPLNLAGSRAEIAGLSGVMVKPPVGDDLWTGGFGLGLNILGSTKDPSNIFSMYFTPEYEAYAKKMKTWADKGYWSKSVLSNKVSMGDAFKNGTSAAALTNLADANAKYAAIMKDHPDWEPIFYPLYPDSPVFRDVYTGNGVAISANSANPERAMMFLNLLNTNEAYHDLTYYGIKGTNYELSADNKLQAVGSNPLYSGEDTSVWGWANPKFTKYQANLSPNYLDILANFAAKAIDSPYASFVLNSDNIKTELAALANVRDQYATPLSIGMVSNVDESLATLKKQLQVAGIDKVVAEVKSQVTAYLANNQ